LRVEIGADRCQVMVPQSYPPAAEAEVDFGEFTALIAGTIMKLYMFCMSHSGKAFHYGYANQTQESFLDGHVRAFEALRGADLDDPLRQFEACGDPGGSWSGMVSASALRGDALPLRL
jgi:hypothetical protein